MHRLWRVAGLLVVFGVCVKSFNLDPESFLVISISDTKGYTPTNESSFFGFSSSLYVENGQPWLLAGAPKANSSISAPGVNNPGAVYKCPLSDGAPRKDLCSELQMDYEGKGPLTNDDQHHKQYTPHKINQWFGVSMDASMSSDTNAYNFVACGHLRKNTVTGVSYKCGNTKKFCYMVTGVCFARSDLYHNRTTAVSRPPKINDLTHNRGTYLFSTQSGTSVHLSMDGSVIMGAPGSLEGQGGVIIKRQNENDTCVISRFINSREGNFLYNFTYVGYSVTSLRLRSSGQVVIASGAPRFNDSGKVYIFMNVDQNICGNQKWRNFQELESQEPGSYGSYFGASILAADVDGDGFEELFVGAPFQSLTSGNEGAVYCYTIEENSATDQFVLVKRLTGSEQPWSRFGTSIALAGDINLDIYNDVFVGAPYEDNGSGAIYLFLGSASGITTPFDQRIAASIFAPQLKTFGHSISSGRDFDGNGYPDVAVGAFESDSVVVVRPRPIHTVRAKIWFPVSVIEGQRQTNESFQVDLIVSFFYTIPYREHGREALLLRNYLNKSASQDSNQSIAFQDSSKISIQFLTVQCRQSVDQQCRRVSFIVVDRPNFYLRLTDNSVYLDDFDMANDKELFQRETSFMLNRSFVLYTPLTIQSISQPRKYLRSEQGNALTTVTWHSGAFPREAVFTVAAEKYIPCIKGLTYDLSIDETKRGFLVNQTNNTVQTVRETIDFTAENLNQPLNRSWTVTFEKYPENVDTPLTFRLNISGPSISENSTQATQGGLLRFKESVMLNDSANKEFFGEIGFFDLWNQDDICTPEIMRQPGYYKVHASDSNDSDTPRLFVNMTPATDAPWIVGGPSDLILSVYIRNLGKPARLVRLTLAHVPFLNPKSILIKDRRSMVTASPFDCSHKNGGVTGVNFDVGESIPENGSLVFNISFEARSVRTGDEYPMSETLEFHAVITAGRRIAYEPQKCESPIQYMASIESKGSSDGQKEFLESRSVTSGHWLTDWIPDNLKEFAPREVTLEHNYDIRNTGPGLMPSVVIDILIPKDAVSKSINISVSYRPSSSSKIFRISQNRNSQVETLASTADINLTCSKVMSCECQPCSPRRFKIETLFPGDSVDIFIGFKTSAASLPENEVLINVTSIVKVATRTVTEQQWCKASSPLKRIISYSIIPIWIYVACVVVGLLILVGVIVCCWKCGFFERKEHEEMKGLLQLMVEPYLPLQPLPLDPLPPLENEPDDLPQPRPVDLLRPLLAGAVDPHQPHQHGQQQLQNAMGPLQPPLHDAFNPLRPHVQLQYQQQYQQQIAIGALNPMPEAARNGYNDGPNDDNNDGRLRSNPHSISRARYSATPHEYKVESKDYRSTVAFMHQYGGTFSASVEEESMRSLNATVKDEPKRCLMLAEELRARHPGIDFTAE